jgi:hypothetical protein
MDMTVDGEIFALFPTLHRTDIPVQMGGNLLPRVENVCLGRIAGVRQRVGMAAGNERFLWAQ